MNALSTQERNQRMFGLLVAAAAGVSWTHFELRNEIRIVSMHGKFLFSWMDERSLSAVSLVKTR